MQMVCPYNITNDLYNATYTFIILILVICNNVFCTNGGTCEVSPVGLTCRLVVNNYSIRYQLIS